MLDGRRHSVDIPLSKTLVALRRVRSLRDPSTNSVTKFSGFADNLTWETDSCNEISLGLVDGSRQCGLDKQSPPGPEFDFNERREEYISDPELDYSARKSDSKVIGSEKLARVGKRGRHPYSKKTEQGEASGYARSNRGQLQGNELFVEGHDSDRRHNTLELACITPSTNVEDVNFSGEATLPSASLEKNKHSAVNRISGYGRQAKSSRAVADVDGSCVGSPYPSLSNGRMDGTCRSTSVFTNEEVDIVEDNGRGCGMSCWSRTPRFREPSFPSDVEDHPLLSKSGEISQSEQEWSSAYSKRENAPCSDSPRSLSHKFRPRSFDELVGQNVVARSLLNAISRGKITSFYLFHGPRGTGKTSASRIFAAALNCLSLEEHRPCGLCRECRLFFSGKSRNVKEVDPARINRIDRMRSLLKSAARPPISSRYKVFVIDECQLLHGETWSIVLSSLDGLPRHVVFVMITADLDSLPRSAVSRCQRYHFPRIKDADIVIRLAKICVEEGMEFDKIALDFVAAKSNGSVRDAEMILDQLSLLGKRITITLAHELIGTVSNEELLDLLKLALSSDTSNTVRRARELMRSRVDPMQLISQLANLIMDILAGKSQTETSVSGSNFHTCKSEADLHKLRNALRILSETEKQLRTSKNQTTWLTVALLQLSSEDSSSLDMNEPKACLTEQRSENGADDRLCCISTTGETMKYSLSCVCCDNNCNSLRMQRDNRGNLETIWRLALQRCQSNTLKRFLQKEGKLSSVRINQGLAVAEVEFCHPDYVSRAEKSWKLIASSLQLVLGCNVEIRINLIPCAAARKHFKVKKPSFSLLSCSRRRHSTTDDENATSDNSDINSSRAIIKETPMETYSSDQGSQFSPFCSHRSREAATTIRNSEGNALGACTATPNRSIQDCARNESQFGIHSSQLKDTNRQSQVLAVHETESQRSCFSKTLRFRRRSRSDDASHNYKSDLPVPQKPYSEPIFCATDPYILYTGANTFSKGSREEDGLEDKHMAHSVRCWRAPKLPFKKAWQLKPQHERCLLVGWLLPCTTAK